MRTLLALLLLASAAHAGRFGIDIAIAIAEAEAIPVAQAKSPELTPESASKPKPKLWYRYGKTCGPCRAFEQDKAAQKFISEHFELVKIEGVVPDFQVEGRGRRQGYDPSFFQWLKDQHFERPSYERQ